MAVIRALSSVEFDLFATVPKRLAAQARMEGLCRHAPTVAATICCRWRSRLISQKMAGVRMSPVSPNVLIFPIAPWWSAWSAASASTPTTSFARRVVRTERCTDVNAEGLCRHHRVSGL